MIERIGEMQMKKRLLTILLVITMIVTMMPTATFAAQAETFGDFIVTATFGDASSVATYDVGTNVLKITGDCTIANTDPNTPTNDTISIESNCTVTLDGVNIEALAPTDNYDITRPNPININGNYQVTINLELGKINTLRFALPSDTDTPNVKRGSGKAGLHVPYGASLTIDGAGELNSTGAEGFNKNDSAAHGGGGAGIGGDGRRTSDDQDAEASGTITIKNGTVNAAGGNAAGNWGGGGAGIGGGGGLYSYRGGNTSMITVEGGYVTATGGNHGIGGGTVGSGIGPGGKGGYCASDASADSVIVSGGTVDASGYYGVQGNYITISGDATRLNAQGTLQALSSAPITSDIGKLVSTTDGTWMDSNKMVQFLTAVDPDYTTVVAANTAAENASYSNMNQVDVTDEATIKSELKTIAEAAVGDGSVTVEVNKVSYTPAVAGTSADPDGTDGSYAFTITVTKGTQSQTTIQKTITITATAYTGVTD
ncbi:MAG TPA: hypothetical protein VHQ24_01035, partial [Lachnospiraceae bacterium]|nr:hypothetical protein [Lachnospiraceae bacterium]